MIEPTEEVPGKDAGSLAESADEVQSSSESSQCKGAFRTLRLARDCVRKGQGFWWDGGWTCKNGEVGQWIAD